MNFKSLVQYSIFNILNAFAVRYIKNVDGVSGCYRGLVPKIFSHTVAAIAFDKTIKSVEFEDEPDTSVPIDDLEDSER